MDEKARAEKKEKTASSHKSKAQRSADAARRNRMRELEAEIEALEVEIQELEAKLNLPEICTDYQKMQEVCDALGAARAKSEADFEELMELEEG